MRVAIITPEQPLHHQHFCSVIAREHELAGVIHPAPATGGGAASRLRRLQREARELGAGYELIRALATVPGPLRGWDPRAAQRDAVAKRFAGAEQEYRDRVGSLAQTVADVNAPESIARLRELEAEVVVCLGGPIYRPALIEAVPLMVNFHSGVSPVYNGTATIAFAFANGHVHLCGGTLMVMSAVVDGGDILAHYLPAVECGDDPGSLFAKTVGGAAEVAAGFLSHLDRGEGFARCPQTPPLFYTRGSDWTIHHGQLVRRLLENGIPPEHLRDERVERYWDAADDGEAQARVRATLDELLRLP
jgi:hypothetical protein